jgi:YD repeat-containing protein
MIGNLITDAQGGIVNIAWTPYGKIRSILKTNDDVIDYAYDAAGNRVSKFVNTSSEEIGYFYVRDAQGNVLAVYRNTEEGLFWDEQHLYGSSRLGMWKPGRLIAEVEGAEEPIPDSSLIGSKQYELTNHLGNVLAVISDKKVGIPPAPSATTKQKY